LYVFADAFLFLVFDEIGEEMKMEGEKDYAVTPLWREKREVQLRMRRNGRLCDWQIAIKTRMSRKFSLIYD
jgi:hypothetical protein